MNKVWFLVVLLLGGSICACSLAHQPTIKYPLIDQLLIDESVFPEGWEAGEPNWEHPPQAPWSGPTKMVEYIDRGFYTDSGSGTAGMVIRQFDSPQAAAREYERKVEISFRDEEWNTSWVVPNDSQFECSQAVQCRYGCSKVLGQLRCAYIAQYEVYTVDFNIKLFDTNVITYTDLPPIFQGIDERMAIALGESNQ